VSLNTGEVRVGATTAIIKSVLLFYIELFNERYPKIKLTVIPASEGRCIELLKAGKLDFCIVRVPFEDELLESTTVLNVQNCFVAGTKYKHLAERRVTLKELIEYPFIVLTPAWNSRKDLDQFVDFHGMKIQPGFEIGSLEVMVEFTKTGLGVSFVTREYVKKELAEGSLFEIKLLESIPSIDFGIVQMKDFTLSVAANKFIQTILSHQQIEL